MTDYTDLIAEARTPHCKDCDHFMRAMADALEASERSLERYKRINPKRAVTKLREAEEARDEFHAKALDAIHEKNRAQDALREAEAVIRKAQGFLEHLGVDHVLAARALATYKPTNQKDTDA